MTATEPQVGMYALRTFKIDAKRGRLLPVNTGAGLRATQLDAWEPSGVCIAECRHLPHAAPHPTCQCGIYGFANLEHLRRQYIQADHVVAVISVEGQVVVGSRGVRAQAARIVGLWVDPKAIPGPVRARMAANMPSVTFFDDVEEMIAGYPDVRATPASGSGGQADVSTVYQGGRMWYHRNLHRAVRWWLGCVAVALIVSFANDVANGLQTPLHPVATALREALTAVMRLLLAVADDAGQLLWGLTSYTIAGGLFAALLGIVPTRSLGGYVCWVAREVPYLLLTLLYRAVAVAVIVAALALHRLPAFGELWIPALAATAALGAYNAIRPDPWLLLMRLHRHILSAVSRLQSRTAPTCSGRALRDG